MFIMQFGPNNLIVVIHTVSRRVTVILLKFWNTLWGPCEFPTVA